MQSLPAETALSSSAATMARPHQLTIHIPFPTARLAGVAITALAVDKELSSAVERAFSLVPPLRSALEQQQQQHQHQQGPEHNSILRAEYQATTNRMLRVAVNGFFLSLAVVLQCMEELDVDVAMDASDHPLDGVQGLEQVKATE